MSKVSKRKCVKACWVRERTSVFKNDYDYYSIVMHHFKKVQSVVVTFITWDFIVSELAQGPRTGEVWVTLGAEAMCVHNLCCSNVSSCRVFIKVRHNIAQPRRYLKSCLACETLLLLFQKELTTIEVKHTESKAEWAMHKKPDLAAPSVFTRSSISAPSGWVHSALIRREKCFG